MAGIILMPVAKLILGKASDLAKEQIGLLWNFRRELSKFDATVSTIQAVLSDAEEKQAHSHQVKDWLEKLSEVMYDAEDLLDDLATEARRKAVVAATTDDAGGRRRMSATTCWSVVCFLLSSLPKQLVYDLKMAHAIKAIRERLDDMAKDRDVLHLEVDTSEEETLPSRETDSCPPKIVIGREDDKKNIIELLLNCNPEANISVVPIVGMGGLGKTTLAQLVFDDDRGKGHFDIKAWVYVSQSFDVQVILLKMLESITGQKMRDLTSDALQAQLRGKIEGRRFLLVLDDAWEESRHSWEKLGNYLAFGALGSKVLLTTRSTKVAEFAGGALNSRTGTSIMEPYLLKGLLEEESWNLLVEKAFPRTVPQERQLQEIGKEILRKCGGVPLAVSTIAGVLVDCNDPKIEWPSFLQKSLSSITKEGEEDPTMSALKLGFNHLPSYMKHCFAYCKLYGKGDEIPIKLLVQLWVAQGYIDSEDKGFDCFKTLWWRSFFQEVQMDGLGNMCVCTMHDLMHDLACWIAGEKIMPTSSLTILKNIPSKTRHLFVTVGDDDDDKREEDHGGDGLGNASKVRTLAYWGYLTSKEVQQVINNFIRLRTLQFYCDDSYSNDEDRSILDAFTSINFYKLKHLRLLYFSCEGRKELPNSISNLVNLQVLGLIDISSLQELPKGIEKLVNLKHLELIADEAGHITHMPKGIGKLKFLQTLPIFVVSKKNGCISNNNTVGAELDELKGLNALCGELAIKGLGNSESPRTGVYVLNEKLHLQSLVLDWSRDDDIGDDVHDVTSLSIHDEGILEMLKPHFNLKKLAIQRGYGGVKIPNWLSGLTNLVEFSLQDCEQCEYLPPQIQQMPSLKRLTIRNCPLLKGIDDVDHHRDSSTIEEEDCEWPQFCCLANLCIEGCLRLTRLPTFPTVEEKMKFSAASLAPLARTMKMKMRREGGVGYTDDFDANSHPLRTSSSSSSSSALVHPLSKLTKLSLKTIDDDFESLSYHDSSGCLISLQELRIGDCRRGVKIPSSLCSSASLTLIHLRKCEMVEYLPSLHGLPSLKELTIWDCPNLKGCWWKKRKGNNDNYGNGGDDDYYNFDPSMEEEREDEEWPRFPCLLALEIGGCPNLTRIPLFPTVERLILRRTSSKALVRTLKMQVVGAAHLDSQLHSTTTATTSPSSQRTALDRPLSNLKKLYLWGMQELKSLPEGLCNLTSLRVLEIGFCLRLATLPPAMRHLTSLHRLEISLCPELTIRCGKGEGQDWPNISHIPNIKLDGNILQGSGWVP
ncbi:unnamed protein product [Linum trigynum]|uniref:Uncharacterized protein n=1 Tax=Linum trigynum TaxID=586398 RepID=A0AAV2GH07_9ROSI